VLINISTKAEKITAAVDFFANCYTGSWAKLSHNTVRTIEITDYLSDLFWFCQLFVSYYFAFLLGSFKPNGFAACLLNLRLISEDFFCFNFDLVLKVPHTTQIKSLCASGGKKEDKKKQNQRGWKRRTKVFSSDFFTGLPTSAQANRQFLAAIDGSGSTKIEYRSVTEDETGTKTSRMTSAR